MTDELNEEEAAKSGEVSDEGFALTRRVRLNRGQGLGEGELLVPGGGSGGGGGGVWTMLLMGAVVFAVGLFIVLISLDVIPTDPSKFNAPRWVVAMIGGVFAAVGLYVLSLGFHAWRLGAALARNALRFPNEPAMADYRWDRERYRERKLGRVLGGLGLSIGLSAFMVPFFWWAYFSGQGPWPVKIGVGFFGLIVVYVAWRALYQLAQWLKYGSTEVRFVAFPYRPGEVVELLWSGGRVVTRYDRLTFTLRCIEQKTVVEQRGNKSHRHTTMTQLWADRYIVDGPERRAYGEDIPVTFLLPTDARSTRIAAEVPIYWELEIEAETPGVDFSARYLVPIYGGGDA